MKWGGLWIKRLKDVNMTLLCMWLWHLKNGEDHLWVRIIFKKYGKQKGGWFTKSFSKPHGYGVWKGIMTHKDFFQGKIGFIVGNGMRTRIWEDV